jgi:L-seryl-tRNA(Ser) seleniumtransferase
MASPLPSVDVLVREAACDAPHALCVREARATLAERRARGEHATASALAPELRRRVRAALEPSLRPVLNATGVVLHTNPGRAPLRGRAGARPGRYVGVFESGLDLAGGAARQDHAAALVCELTGMRRRSA